MTADLTPRRALENLDRYVDAFRVVIVGGPRQAGKTTLLRQLQKSRGGTFLSLDDGTLAARMRDDPRAFAALGSVPRIIDEVQLGGDGLVRSIKMEADASNAPGQFVLSGSTRFLTVPTLSESLAGRAVLMDLWPLSAAERTGALADAPSDLFDVDRMVVGEGASPWSRSQYAHLISTGGYPEVVRLRDVDMRESWFDSYLSLVVLRDVASFADIRQADVVPKLLRLVAARSGSQLVVSDIAQSLGVARATVQDYLRYLDIVYLTSTVPPWSTNLTSRVVKTPKVYATDAGMVASLVGAGPEVIEEPGNPTAGLLVETFVYTELLRQLGTSSTRAEISFYRDRSGREIDFVLERRDGGLVGVEVKASSSVRSTDFKHLAWFRDQVGERFVGGYVVHLGEHRVPWGDRLAAVPLSALWQDASLQVG